MLDNLEQKTSTNTNKLAIAGVITSFVTASYFFVTSTLTDYFALGNPPEHIKYLFAPAVYATGLLKHLLSGTHYVDNIDLAAVAFPLAGISGLATYLVGKGIRRIKIGRASCRERV